MDHIIIYSEGNDAIERIRNGEKTTVIRAADCRKLPQGLVFEGDRLFFAVLKNSAHIVLRAAAGVVYNSKRLDKEKSEKLILDSKEKYHLTDAEISSSLGKPFISFVEIKDLKKVEPPLDFILQDNEAKWMVHDNINGLVGLVL